jgi:hypothetical protein
MHNKKLLSQVIKDLDKAKAPSKPKDIDYNSQMGYRDDSPFRNKSSMDIYTPDGTIDMSNTGMPLIANGQYLPPYSGTHQFNTNVVTEEPLDQAKKGFEIKRPKTRNLKSKKYSRSLEATNELFTVHEFFQKPKSKKNKIYNPNAKYYKKGGGVDPAFEKKLEQVAKNLKVSKADLIGIMKHESGLNPAAVNPSTGATGLIQFMPATARAMGTSTEALRNMSAIEQLDYVEKFYKPIAGKAKDIGDLYMFTFLPAAVGKSNDFVIGAKGSGNAIWGISQDALYRQNAGFDLNKKGYYTVGDVKTKISTFSGQPLIKEKGLDLAPGDLKPGEEKITFTSNPVEKEEVKNEPLFPLEYYMQQNELAASRPKANPLMALAPKRALNAGIQAELTPDQIRQYVEGGYIVEELDPTEFQKGGDVNSGAGMSSKSKGKTAAQIAADKALDAKLSKLTANNKKPPGAYKKDPVFQQVADQTKKNALAHQDSKKKVLNNFIIKPVTPFNYESPLDTFVKNNTPNLTKEQKAQMKAEEDKAVQDAIMSKGMLNNTGKLDPEREEFIRNQVRAKYNNASSQYYKDKKEIDAKIARVDPSSVLTKKSKYKDYDVFQTTEQKAKEQIDQAAQNLINSGAAFNYYKKDNSGKDYKELIMDDLIKANNNNQDLGKVIENIQNKKDESDYKLLKDSYDKLPFFDPNFSNEDKVGQIWRGFAADPFNVVEEAIWDKDFMPGRHTILRDPSHPLYNYYTKRTQMDESPLSQALQYINPFSSAAEASVAINKGDYKEGAKQFGEGMLKTVGLLALPEVIAAGGSYVLPGAASVGLPGLTYTAALEGIGMAYGATQLPTTYRSIEKAVKSGKKEDWRAAVNQTATNTLDFLGAVDFFKGVTTIPEAVTYRMLSKGSDATGFGKNLTKEAEKLKNLYNKNPLNYDAKVAQSKKTWEQAMDQVKAKYADKGYNMTADEILSDPVKAQYLKDEFLKIKEEGLKFMKSDEGKKAVEQMFKEFPESKKMSYESSIKPENLDEVKELIFKKEGIEKFVNQGVKNYDEAIKPLEENIGKARKQYEDIMGKPDANDPDWMNKLNREKNKLDALEHQLEGIKNSKAKYVEYFDKNDPQSFSEIPFGFTEAPFGKIPYTNRPLDFEPSFNGQILRKHESYIPDTPIMTDIDLTYDDYIKAYEDISYRDQSILLNKHAEVNALQIKYENELRDLMQMDPADPNYERMVRRVDSSKNRYQAALDDSSNAHAAYNWHEDNAVELGNKFLPNEGETILAHEVSHTNPQVRAFVKDQLDTTGQINWNKAKPTGYVRKTIDGQLWDIPYLTPVDKVLAEIDILPAGKMGPGFNMQHYNFRVKPKEFIPSTADEVSGSFFSHTDGGFFGPDGIDAKNYFLNGGNGNEKEAFLAELKQFMLKQGYGKRGQFTLKDVNEFWGDYLKTSQTAKSDNYRLRLLDIADPTKNTRERIVKALNMPSGYKEGGEVEYNLGDEVDEATMRKLEKQGFVFQKIR